MSTQNKEILVIGSFFTDLCFYTDEFPLPGQTVNSHQFSTGFGGKGSNQSIAANNINNNVHLITSLGDDSFGHNAKEYYNKINLSYFSVNSQKPTGCAGIFINSNGQNEIVINQGAMEDLTLENIKENLDQTIQNNSIKLIILQNEINYQDCLDIMTYLKQKYNQIEILLNPAPFRQDYNYEKLLPLTDYFVPNETEYECLSKQVNLKDQQFSKIKYILTLGDKGAQLPDKTIIPAYKVTAVDTTGAGDCWIGTFASMYVKTNDLQKSAQFANKCSSISVTRKGTSISFPKLEEVKEFM